VKAESGAASEWFVRPAARRWRTAPLVDDVTSFHRTMPGYAETPLVEVPAFAAELQVGRVFVKDESSRLGLPAFKILGASYAVSRALAARYGLGPRALPLSELAHRAATDRTLTMSAASDGNHGRAVARVGAMLGVAVTIYVPAAITAAAKAAIAGEGARLVEFDQPYDRVVSVAAEHARMAGPGHLVVQDAAWDGYEQVPRWIVDGYSTLFAETDAQLAAAGAANLDFGVVPVGVGAFAQAAVHHYRSGRHAPTVLTVEPDRAPAVITSLHANRLVSVMTQPTIMAGLNCGTPSSIAWPYLVAGVDAAVTVTDEAAALAVADLAVAGLDSGPCGAATLAGARAALLDPGRRAELALGEDAVLVLFSTESRAANPLPNLETAL
jgi:diaminopropionate ammonia-lyase